METFRDELRIWRVGDSFDPRPPPLIIETYLDTSDLTPTQALVILDSDEKRWNVAEALENAANRAGVNLRSRAAERSTNAAQKIVLERWKIELRYDQLPCFCVYVCPNTCWIPVTDLRTFLKSSVRS
jgi:autophagy-related protein 13